jgi:heme/copper-type cytochrome/quinol oxidase subunit 1
MAIAVPTGIKIFNWLATMWGGQIHFKTPMLFCIAFLFQFLIAGLTGVMLSAAPFDWQLTGNSYFVVAHFHYVIVGGILFTLFGAFYYWFPKMSGRMYNERLGKLHFWLFLIGFHLTFDFMHIPGILGMPRRIYTYEPGRGWDIWNLIVTIGVFFQAAGVLVFVATCCGLLPGRDGRERSLGCMDARMVHHFAAAAYNFAKSSRRSRAAARCGTSSIRKIPIGTTSKETPMSAPSSPCPKAISNGIFPRAGPWECIA